MIDNRDTHREPLRDAATSGKAPHWVIGRKQRSVKDSWKGLGGFAQEMVSQGRFELPTFPLGGGCSIQLSY